MRDAGVPVGAVKRIRFGREKNMTSLQKTLLGAAAGLALIAASAGAHASPLLFNFNDGQGNTLTGIKDITVADPTTVIQGIVPDGMGGFTEAGQKFTETGTFFQQLRRRPGGA